ncbi:SMP-30/gluconolactonase/LRE family protein [Thioclava atlantica]|uniref:SMP-30/gluconolaconase/LRE-like region-containing protein n=1 Tax=Thioclava atlantica TaxID=1317124 RepID=A0A085U0B8_9RHOB|nr:SMP-30/gluconolactonase/LRE family protein [Thioclava atlantica]KFE36415.1 SMP-30/gluconolaconase/LRE-like region-containing protein [Thioclava atlantica]
MTPFDTRLCELGEGALWHPLRGELFWFDILGRHLLSRHPETHETREVALPEICSAAAWIDAGHLLVASETGLRIFDIAAGRLEKRLVALEADQPGTRSNDGRADPWGGFWIGTMGKSAAREAGSLYRYARGELRRLVEGITIPNAICFSPARELAYFADTATGQLYRVALDAEGWPAAAPESFVDFAAHGLSPDGAVTLADGSLRVALWGAGAVIAVSPEGELGERIALAAPQPSCPAMGGPDFTTLYCTSAQEGMGPDALAAAPLSGAVFTLSDAGQGRAEPAFRIATAGDE